jgi:uncharacterized protein GlcG (DUF336 family)
MNRSLIRSLLAAPLLLGVCAVACLADDDNNNKASDNKCRDLPTAAQLKAQLVAAPALTNPPVVGGTVGGLFGGTKMWAAVVNRNGEVCAAVASTSDPTNVWPGSQAIAKAKAYTANAFSLDDFALSTARLYTFTQPGHSLWSLGQSNPFNPQALATPSAADGSTGQLAGGMIFFGGGVPIYKGGKIVGGLGVSGDTSCADHEIAKRVRHMLDMNPPLPGGALADDIKYSTLDGPGVFTHPLCINTYRNGGFVGTEANSSGY